MSCQQPDFWGWAGGDAYRSASDWVAAISEGERRLTKPRSASHAMASVSARPIGRCGSPNSLTAFEQSTVNGVRAKRTPVNGASGRLPVK